MSGRALRLLREEREAEAAAAAAGDGSSSDDDDESEAGGHGGAFAQMLLGGSSSDESSSSSDEDEDSDGDEEEAGEPAAAAAGARDPGRKARGRVDGGKEEKEEEDLDAILTEMNITPVRDAAPDGGDGEAGGVVRPASARRVLLSRDHGYDPSDLDLDGAVRSLLGAGHVVPAGGDGEGAPPGRLPRGARGRNARGSRGGNGTRVGRRYLFQKPKSEWGRPPSYVGGGIGTRECVAEDEVPWPYSLGREGDEGREEEDDAVASSIPPRDEQRWYTLDMSDTYQEADRAYRQLLSASGGASAAAGGGLHDPNALAMFVADNPFFAETLLQLAMVLLYVNDRARGNDLLRRCLFVYETALPGSVLPGGDECAGEVLVDVDESCNSGLFSCLFRIMQTSGMAGCHAQALATGRFLLSLDPARDPAGCLPILDYYALASRRPSAVGSGEEADPGARFVVDLVECGRVGVHHRDPLTDRHHACDLVGMPNWAYSYALALYRLSAAGGDDGPTRERADDALVSALTRFPRSLPRILEGNKVDVSGRSFRSDWPAVVGRFAGDGTGAEETAPGVEERVARASGEHLEGIFVRRCHKLWAEEDVSHWMYTCAVRAAEEADARGGGGGGEGGDAAAPAALRPEYSPALARYASCDPSEYEDSFRTFPPEAIALDPNLVAPAVRVGDGRRGRFLRNNARGQRAGAGMPEERDVVDALRGALGLGPGGGAGDVELLDPDSPLLQLYLQSLLPWAQVDGVAPPPRRE